VIAYSEVNDAVVRLAGVVPGRVDKKVTEI